MLKNRQEVKEARAYFLKNNVGRTEIRKGDKRVLGNRICSLCREPLSRTLPNGKGVSLRDHLDMDMAFYHMYMCKDSRICNSNTGGGESINGNE